MQESLLTQDGNVRSFSKSALFFSGSGKRPIPVMTLHPLSVFNSEPKDKGTLTIFYGRRIPTRVVWLVGKKKLKNKVCLHVHVGGKKEITGKFYEFFLLFLFLTSFFY